MVPKSQLTPLTSVRVGGGGNSTHSFSSSSSDWNHPGTLLRIALSCTALLLCVAGVLQCAGVLNSSSSVEFPAGKLSQAARACTFKDMATGLKLNSIPPAAVHTHGDAVPCGLIRQGLFFSETKNPQTFEERTSSRSIFMNYAVKLKFS